MSLRQDKFGYYVVGDLKFYSKFDAILAEQRTGHKLHWYFNEDVYSAVDWGTEPIESLEELYRLRAQQIRDQYDYVILWYSSGADSANILNSFINNNIKIDELVSYVNYDATGDRDNHLNGEIFNFAPEFVKQAQLAQPHLKYTMLDMLEPTLTYFQQKDAKFDWMRGVNGHYSPNNLARHDMKLSRPEWRSMYNTGKKVAWVSGIDKPWVSRINDQYYFRFIDLFVGPGASAAEQEQDRPWEFNELFYWSPDCPQLVVKQAHLIKNYISATHDFSDPVRGFQFEKLTDGAPRVMVVGPGTFKCYLKTDYLHLLIYPGWIPNPYQAKSPNLLLSNRDKWFFDMEDSNPAKRAWRMGFDEFWRRVPDSHKFTPENINNGLHHHPSKIYCLTT